MKVQRKEGEAQQKRNTCKCMPYANVLHRVQSHRFFFFFLLHFLEAFVNPSFALHWTWQTDKHIDKPRNQDQDQDLSPAETPDCWNHPSPLLIFIAMKDVIIACVGKPSAGKSSFLNAGTRLLVCMAVSYQDMLSCLK